MNKEELNYHRIRMKKFNKIYPWINALRCAKQRCENLNNDSYKYYGNRGIKFYLSDKEGQILWFRDKAYLMKKPSIDREDNDGNYTFDNCRFIELKENIAKAFRKPILQFDLDKHFIKEWLSAIEVEKVLKINQSNISRVCLGKRKTAGGFIFQYKEINYGQERY